MEEDDPVVQEIPVFLSQALTENLQIFQYPVRPGNRDWTEMKVVNAAIKPKNNLVRLEVGLDTDADTYCASRGEQIAINTDGFQESTLIAGSSSKDKDRAPYFRNLVMDKIVYESTQPCTNTDMYAVGILQDKELHLTPIQSIVQLRPACSYFDRQEKRTSDKSKSNSDDKDEEDEPEAKQVTVKFARQETEVAKKAREKSFKVISQRISEEPWYDSLYLHANTDQGELERLKLFSATSADGSSLSLRGRDYIKLLVPPPPEMEGEAVPKKTLSIPERIKQILINAKLMRFSDLCAMILGSEEGVSEAMLLSLLAGAACCVRGLWAARSADLYTHAAPVPARLLTAHRDHVVSVMQCRQRGGSERGDAAVSAGGRGLWAARSADLYTHAAPVPARLLTAHRDHVVSVMQCRQRGGSERGDAAVSAGGRGLWAARSADLYTHAAPVPARLLTAHRDHVVSVMQCRQRGGSERGDAAVSAGGRGLWAARSADLYTHAAPVPARLLTAHRDHVVSVMQCRQRGGSERGDAAVSAGGRGLWAARSADLYTHAAPVPARLLTAHRDHVVSVMQCRQRGGSERGDAAVSAGGRGLWAARSADLYTHAAPVPARLLTAHRDHVVSVMQCRQRGGSERGDAAVSAGGRGLWAARSADLYTHAAPVPARLLTAHRDHVVSVMQCRQRGGSERGDAAVSAGGRGLWAARSADLYTHAAPVPARLLTAHRDHVVSVMQCRQRGGSERGDAAVSAGGRGLWAARSADLYTHAAPVPARLLTAHRDHVVSVMQCRQRGGSERGDAAVSAGGRGLWAARSADLYTHAAPVPARLLTAHRDHVVSVMQCRQRGGSERGDAAVSAGGRGLWAARSADLYTHAAPVPARLLTAHRDHVLYLFTQHTYIDRRKVAAAARLPPQEVEDIIKSVAKYNPDNGWELIIPPDTAFEAKYPDVVQRQNLYWEARQRLFNDMLIGENIPKRQRKKSQRDSICSDSLMSPKPRCTSVSEEDSDSKKRPKNKGVGKRTRNVSSCSAQEGT